MEVITWANRPKDRPKERPTHFFSIPLGVPLIMSGLAHFKEAVLAQNKDAINEQLFQSPAKLHLTLGVLCLFSEEEEMAAAEAVKEVVCQI